MLYVEGEQKDNMEYNNHSCHLLSTYYVPLVYSVRQVLFPFSPFFLDEETEAQKS